jgi:shikimate kinase
VVAADRIALLGARGTGKTTIARILAGRLGWSWVDTDDLIEATANQTIARIFATEGEPAFRDRESVALLAACESNRTVIATGGGIVVRDANRALLNERCFCVWLTCTPEVAFRRMQDDATTIHRRPALAGGGLPEIRSLMTVREPHYRSLARFTVDTTSSPLDEIARSIIDAAGLAGHGNA